MSKMSALDYDIEQLYIEGYKPKSIASQLGCTLEMVYDWIESNGCGWDETVVEVEEFSPYSTSNS